MKFKVIAKFICSNVLNRIHETCDEYLDTILKYINNIFANVAMISKSKKTLESQKTIVPAYLERFYFIELLLQTFGPRQSNHIFQ